MDATPVFNLSPFHAYWNELAFEQSTRMREEYQDRLFDLAQKSTSTLTTQDLLDVSYRDFLHTRELGLTAGSKLEFRAKQVGLLLARPYHYWKYHSVADFD
ncbi:MAG: hypothetical protein AABX35_04325 [Nanoarchaeota archaeon]